MAIVWETGVITATRATKTLNNTIKSIVKAGWKKMEVFRDVHGHGIIPMYIKTMRALYAKNPDADWYFLVQDDTSFCCHVKEYMEQTMPKDACICSPYSPMAYMTKKAGWIDQSSRGPLLIGALTYALTNKTLCDIANQLASIDVRASLSKYCPGDPGDWIKEDRHVDSRVGAWALDNNSPVYYHSPSLSQHTGLGNSVLENPTINETRQAGDFVGEDFELGVNFTPPGEPGGVKML